MSSSAKAHATLPRALREARDRLRNLEHLDAAAIRLSATREARVVGDGVAGSFWTLTDVEGELALHAETTDATMDLTAFWQGMRALSWPAQHFNPRRPPRGSVNRFEPGGKRDLRRRFIESGVYTWWRTIRFGDQLRVYLYRGTEFLGALGMARYGSSRHFTARDAARAQPLVPDLLAAVSAAASAERGEPADFVVRADGTVEFASSTGKPWLARADFGDELSRVVQALDARTELLREPPRSLLLKQACASWIRLDGASGHGGHRYLVHVRPFVALHRDDAMLTAAQAKIAEYLVAGATVKETAVSMSVSPETVRSHIKGIYGRLAISSRAELVAKFRSPA